LTVPFQDQGGKAEVVLKGRRFYDIPIQQQSYDALVQGTELLRMLPTAAHLLDLQRSVITLKGAAW
jgi:hypothetical protein